MQAESSRQIVPAALMKLHCMDKLRSALGVVVNQANIADDFATPLDFEFAKSNGPGYPPRRPDDQGIPGGQGAFKITSDFRHFDRR